MSAAESNIFPADPIYAEANPPINPASGVLAGQAAMHQVEFCPVIFPRPDADFDSRFQKFAALSKWPDIGTANPLDSLMPAERDVLGLVALGKGNTEIAQRIVISPRTAKFHISNMLEV